MEADLLMNGISSIILIAFLSLFRRMLQKHVDGFSFENVDDLQKWHVQIRNAWLVLISLGLIFIWSSELKTFALSLVAIAAAIAVGAKELILCFIGGVVRSSSKIFEIGDRIHVNNVRGDVIDYTILNTTLLEVGPESNVHLYTGKKINIPNSLFLVSPLVNETNQSKYILHTFTLSFSRQCEWQNIENEILSICNEFCKPYMQEASETISFYSTRTRKSLPTEVSPKIFISLSEKDLIHFTVRVPALSKERGKLEQMIMRRLLQKIAL